MVPEYNNKLFCPFSSKVDASRDLRIRERLGKLVNSTPEFGKTVNLLPKPTESLNSTFGLSNHTCRDETFPKTCDTIKSLFSSFKGNSTVSTFLLCLSLSLAGHDVKNLIHDNVYQGLEARLKFNTWKSV